MTLLKIPEDAMRCGETARVRAAGRSWSSVSRHGAYSCCRRQLIIWSSSVRARPAPLLRCIGKPSVENGAIHSIRDGLARHGPRYVLVRACELFCAPKVESAGPAKLLNPMESDLTESDLTRCPASSVHTISRIRAHALPPLADGVNRPRLVPISIQSVTHQGAMGASATRIQSLGSPRDTAHQRQRHGSRRSGPL